MSEAVVHHQAVAGVYEPSLFGTYSKKIGMWLSQARHQHRDALIADYSNTLGKAFKCFELESGYVETLQLFGRVRSYWH